MYSVDDLYAFAALIESGSVTSAASQLQLNPATVSRRLTKLENHLGVPLFLRNTRNFSVTAEGQDFYADVAEAIALLRAAETNLHGHGQAPSGKLRIALPSWVLFKILHNKLGAFLDSHPHLQLDFLTTEDPISLVGEGRDIGIRFGELGDSSLKARKLYDETIKLCASPSYLERMGTPESLVDLKSHTALSHPSDYQLTQVGTNQPGKHVSWGRQHTMNSSNAAHAAALSGIGLTQLYGRQAADDLASGTLIEVLADAWDRPRVPAWFIRTDGRIGTPKVDAFRNFILEQCSDSRPDFC